MAEISIFHGWEELTAKAFGLGGGQHLKQKTTCRKLSESRLDIGAASNLVKDISDSIGASCTSRMPSRENWRTERQTTISPQNKSSEVVLERAIAALGERGDLPEWINQVPVASGIAGSYVDKRAAVDLIRMDDASADLVELKWESDTPAYAAIEILRYGLAYLVCRDRTGEFDYKDKILLQLPNIRLMVLAPATYYKGYDLGFLKPLINDGLDRLCSGRDDGLTMSFSFHAFPNGFRIPFASGAEVKGILNGTADEEKCSTLIRSINNIAEIWV